MLRCTNCNCNKIFISTYGYLTFVDFYFLPRFKFCSFNSSTYFTANNDERYLRNKLFQFKFQTQVSTLVSRFGKNRTHLGVVDRILRMPQHRVNNTQTGVSDVQTSIAGYTGNFQDIALKH